MKKLSTVLLSVELRSPYVITGRDVAPLSAAENLAHWSAASAKRGEFIKNALEATYLEPSQVELIPETVEWAELAQNVPEVEAMSTYVQRLQQLTNVMEPTLKTPTPSIVGVKGGHHAGHADKGRMSGPGGEDSNDGSVIFIIIKRQGGGEPPEGDESHQRGQKRRPNNE